MIAAAFEIALLAFSPAADKFDAVSLESTEAPMAMPLILKSLAAKATPVPAAAATVEGSPA